jgi:hypothetical protein
MVSTRNPETMTEPERRREIASLLAAALVRRVRQVRDKSGTSKEALDLSSETRLSVAKRPHG